MSFTPVSYWIFSLKECVILKINSIRTGCNTLILHPPIRSRHINFFSILFTIQNEFTPHTIIVLKTIKISKNTKEQNRTRSIFLSPTAGHSPAADLSLSLSLLVMVLIVMGLDMDQFGEREKTRQDLLSLSSLVLSFSPSQSVFLFIFESG